MPMAPDVTMTTCRPSSSKALTWAATPLKYAVSIPPSLARVFVPILMTTRFVLLKFLIGNGRHYTAPQDPFKAKTRSGP